jgi:hypothetical protein
MSIAPLTSRISDRTFPYLVKRTIYFDDLKMIVKGFSDFKLQKSPFDKALRMTFASVEVGISS